MAIDIRVPIGLLFLVLGGMLVVFGAVTHFSDPTMYERSLGVNINFWWGLVMLAFGAGMYHYGARRVREQAPTTE